MGALQGPAAARNPMRGLKVLTASSLGVRNNPQALPWSEKGHQPGVRDSGLCLSSAAPSLGSPSCVCTTGGQLLLKSLAALTSVPWPPSSLPAL